METRQSINDNSMRRILLMAPMLGCIALSACSDASGTAVKERAAPYGVTSYMAQGEKKAGDDTGDPDPGASYEWFY